MPQTIFYSALTVAASLRWQLSAVATASWLSAICALQLILQCFFYCRFFCGLMFLRSNILWLLIGVVGEHSCRSLAAISRRFHAVVFHSYRSAGEKVHVGSFGKFWNPSNPARNSAGKPRQVWQTTAASYPREGNLIAAET